MFYTFLKSTGVHLYTASNAQSQAGQWAACLANETGVASDFVVKESDSIILSGQIATLQNDRVIMSSDPEVTARLGQINALKAKLIGLGLTPGQVDLII